MASSTQPLPDLVSVPRITTLLASLLVSVGSGTHYVFSAYAPQLGERLNITYTQLNVVGLAASMGVYSSAPIWGRIVDSRGPRIPLAGAFILLLTGYSGIRYFYDTGLPTLDSTLPTFSFYLLVFCNYLTGFGGNGGLCSSLNSTAKTFPDRARATTTGLVLSGFGLSAFIFSAIAHFAFAGNTSSFLLLLSAGTALPMIVGFFFVRPIPLPSSEFIQALENGVVRADSGESTAVHASAAAFQRHNDSRTPLLSPNNQAKTSTSYQATLPNLSPEILPSDTRSSSPHGLRNPPAPQKGLSQPADIAHSDLPDISGRELFISGDFWLLFTILSMLVGTGFMYISNVGSMSQALLAKNNPFYDETEALRWQAAQVSSISIMNFFGRIFIGLVSDFTKAHLRLPRSYCLTLVSSFFLASQIAAAAVDDIHRLWIASALLGLAHGSVSSFFPILCIEWFGMPHFSENWGYMALAPIFTGNFFSVAFGRNLDAHEPPKTQTLFGTSAVKTLSASHRCLEGRKCYVDGLSLTIAACSLALGLSVWAGWRDRQRIAAAQLKRLATITELEREDYQD